MKTLPRVLVTAPCVNVATMQVCAVKDATDEEILEVCNRENPAGTDHDGTLFHEANKAPVQCSDHADRTHFLVTC